ncbi:MAG TPA: glycosyltransferase, partial [Kineosporiaceae bacterium]|nr:glycosyltransferase [Kineosporiaceae bacterium]
MSLELAAQTGSAATSAVRRNSDRAVVLSTADAPSPEHPASRSGSAPTPPARPPRPRVTAVLVSRGGERYLPRTLDAVAAQTRPPDLLVAAAVGSAEVLPLLAAATRATVGLPVGSTFADGVRAALSALGAGGLCPQPRPRPDVPALPGPSAAQGSAAASAGPVRFSPAVEGASGAGRQGGPGAGGGGPEGDMSGRVVVAETLAAEPGAAETVAAEPGAAEAVAAEPGAAEPGAVGAESVPDAPHAPAHAEPAAVSASAMQAGAGSGAEWLWLLHDDGAPAPDVLERLLAAVETGPSVGVAGCKQVAWDDDQRLLDVGFTTSRFGLFVTGVDRYEVDQGQHDDRCDVMAVSSAGMLIRRDLWDRLGGFDPALAHSRDDLDLCRRARLAGYRVVVVPTAVVAHAAGSALGERTGEPGHRGSWLLADRRDTLHLRYASVWWWLLPVAVLASGVAAVLRALGRLALRQPRRALDELLAWVIVSSRPWSWLVSRRRTSEVRVVPRRTLRPLLATRRQLWRHRRDAVAVWAGRALPPPVDVAAARPPRGRRAGTVAASGPARASVSVRAAEGAPPRSGDDPELVVNLTDAALRAGAGAGGPAGAVPPVVSGRRSGGIGEPDAAEPGADPEAALYRPVARP